MPQMILYLSDDEDIIVTALKTKHNLKSKHETIKLMIDSFKNKVGDE